MTKTGLEKKGVITIYFVSSFLLHLIWENLQAPLFHGFENFFQHFIICLFATATGDMLFMVVIYLVLAVVHNDLMWINRLKNYKHPATWIIPALLGLLMAVSFEFWAVYVVERWSYNTMPIIPILMVGLTPVLQMVIVPLMVLYISRIYIKSSSF